MSDNVVNEITRRLTGVEHETIRKLHRLCMGRTELAGNDDLAALRTRLHDEAKDTIAGPSNDKTSEKLVSEGLALDDGRQTTVQDLLGVELKQVFGILESLLNECDEVTDAAALLSKDFLGVGGTDDNLYACM